MAIRRTGAADAYKLKKVGYLYLDIRAPEEYDKGHPVGAVNVPFKLFTSSGGFKDNPRFMSVMQTLYPTNTKILVIGKVGKRSMQAAEALEKAGYSELCELRPGYKGIVDTQGRYSEDGWETMGLPSETQTDGGSYKELRAASASVAPPPQQETKQATGPTTSIQRMGAADAYKLKNVGYLYLDIRAPEEYAKGHPVGAVNVPFKLFTSSGGFKANPLFLSVMEALYPKDTKILVIGKVGKRSLQAAEVLEQAGYKQLCELRPGYKGLVDTNGRYSEDGWETMGLATETSTDGGSFKELKERAG